MFQNRTARALIVASLITVGLLFAFAAGIGTAWVLLRGPAPVAAPPQQMAETKAEDIGLFWEAWHLVEEHFYGELPDAQHLAWGAIRGALTTLNDPHTVLLEPQPRQREKEALSGRFGGIGAGVSRTDEGLIVLDPRPGLPAERAGVQSGDAVIQVDDTPITAEMSAEDVVGLIRGEVGTEVRLTLQRAGQSEPFVVTIVREEIPSPTVDYRLLEEQPGTGYVRISLFSDRTDAELSDAIDDLETQGMERLVLDLRGNGGGLLDAAVKVASEFLQDGVVLYQVQKGGQERTYDTTGRSAFPEGMVVVLVDGGTASASEIVAGALQDRGRAVLVGEKTYGKGSVQQVFDLSDGSSVHITFADWLTPNRQKITGVGLTPEFQVPITDDDRNQGRDPQLERAVQYLSEQAGK